MILGREIVMMRFIDWRTETVDNRLDICVYVYSAQYEDHFSDPSESASVEQTYFFICWIRGFCCTEWFWNGGRLALIEGADCINVVYVVVFLILFALVNAMV